MIDRTTKRQKAERERYNSNEGNYNIQTQLGYDDNADDDDCTGDGGAWKMRQMFNVGTFPYGTLRRVCVTLSRRTLTKTSSSSIYFAVFPHFYPFMHLSAAVCRCCCYYL